MNNKTMKNSYVKNQFDGYSGSKYMKNMQYKKPHKRIQTTSEGYKTENKTGNKTGNKEEHKEEYKEEYGYNYEYQNPKYYQGGVDPSGSVYVNSNYDIAENDPGISWIL